MYIFPFSSGIHCTSFLFSLYFCLNPPFPQQASNTSGHRIISTQIGKRDKDLIDLNHRYSIHKLQVYVVVCMSLVVLSARELFCVTTAKVKTVTKKKSLAQKHVSNISSTILDQLAWGSHFEKNYNNMANLLFCYWPFLRSVSFFLHHSLY